MSVHLNTTSTTALPTIKWEVSDQKIAIFRENETLKYEAQSGDRKKKGALKNTYYQADYALQLINLFRKILWVEGSRTPHILPYAFTDVAVRQNNRLEETTDLIVALWGEYGAPADSAGRLLKAEWGIYQRSSGQIIWIQADPQWGCIKEFFLGMRDNHSFYLRYFRPIVVLDTNGVVQSIELQCVSLMNRNILLSTTHWAVTLVSQQQAMGVGCRHGHALIACEGVDENHIPFLKYIHLVAPQNKGRLVVHTIEGYDARKAESLLRKSLTSPTWSRSKEKVKPMFDFAEKIKGERIQFSRLAPLINMWRSLTDIASSSLQGNLLQNCLSQAVHILRRGSIFLPEPKRPDPNTYIKNLHEKYEIEVSGDSISALPNDPDERLQALVSNVVVTAVAFVHSSSKTNTPNT